MGIVAAVWNDVDRYYNQLLSFPREPIIIRCFTMLIDRRHNYAAELAALRMPDAQLMPPYRRIIGHRAFSLDLFPSFRLAGLAPLSRKQTENIVLFASSNPPDVFVPGHVVISNCQICRKFDRNFDWQIFENFVACPCEAYQDWLNSP